jgi:hypothetical protein
VRPIDPHLLPRELLARAKVRQNFEDIARLVTGDDGPYRFAERTHVNHNGSQETTIDLPARVVARATEESVHGVGIDLPRVEWVGEGPHERGNVVVIVVDDDAQVARSRASGIAAVSRLVPPWVGRVVRGREADGGVP